MWHLLSVLFVFAAGVAQAGPSTPPHPGGTIPQNVRLKSLTETCKSITLTSSLVKSCVEWMRNFSAHGMHDTRDARFFDRSTLNPQGVPTACQTQADKDLVPCLSWWYAVKAKQDNKTAMIKDLLEVPPPCRKLESNEAAQCFERFYFEPGSFLYKPDSGEAPTDDGEAAQNGDRTG
jgi:hypothetical protein